MVSFIHTADWQIGKPYLQIKDEQKRFKLQEERLKAIKRIGEAANYHKSSFIIVAGDLFDSPTPPITAVLEVLEAIGNIDIPVFVIPGNHDHGSLGTIWHREDFKNHQKQLAPNFQLFLKKEPYEIENSILLPCPLLRNKESSDPTLWLRNFNWNSLPKKKSRIVIAHGAVQNFAGRNYLLDQETQIRSHNLIDLEKLQRDEIDYIALGDWHNLKQINSHTWYSGTPEPDRFDHGQENHRGQVLNVNISRSGNPQVESIQTGKIKWHNMTFQFNNERDLDRFKRQIENLIGTRVSRDLLRIEISGALSFAAHRKYQEITTDLENKLLRLRIKGECLQIPKDSELETLTRNLEDPLIAQVASELKQRLTVENINDHEKSSITIEALSELFRFAVNN